MIDVVVGFDQREAIAYHVFCQSVLARSSIPVRFMPLTFSTAHRDGSNSFIYSRFLTPWFMNYEGWALYADSDMLCLADLSELWLMRNPRYAVQVVKHDYKTRHPVKYFGAKNDDYPRKNWSSLILWNCHHYKNKQLTPAYISDAEGKNLHRFEWLDDSDIGELPIEWNWLPQEFGENQSAKIVHYTIGTPCLQDFVDTEMADVWDDELTKMQQGLGD